jgi:hypothetical protein
LIETHDLSRRVLIIEPRREPEQPTTGKQEVAGAVAVVRHSGLFITDRTLLISTCHL